jgi:hypothetical protein
MQMISKNKLSKIFKEASGELDTISKIRCLQTCLNNVDLDIPKLRREVNTSNMRWLLRNVKVRNPKSAVRIITLIKEII